MAFLMPTSIQTCFHRRECLTGGKCRTTWAVLKRTRAQIDHYIYSGKPAGTTITGNPQHPGGVSQVSTVQVPARALRAACEGVPVSAEYLKLPQRSIQ
jgi:hypothetical protein